MTGHNLRSSLGSAAVLVTATLLLASVAASGAATAGSVRQGAVQDRSITLHGFRFAVPQDWRVVDLRNRPYACVRFDRPAVYLGHIGDQAACPARVIGGAPALLVEPADRRALSAAPRPLVLVPPGQLRSIRLPETGPTALAIEGAGVLVTAVYGDADTHTVQHVLENSSITGHAHARTVRVPPPPQATPADGVTAPGTLLGKGFDACAAPSQSVMDAWWKSTDYASFGIYIGGASRGCAQPNLTAAWVSQQAATGWHLVPTYVGSQAPCTHFQNRMSYSLSSARAEGRTEASDAVSEAGALGIVAPSTIFVDIEAYDSSNAACVRAVLGYVSGWTYQLHRSGYQAGVYSSASSGIHDLSTHYDSPGFLSPDDIWIAWWNGKTDVDGGTYVPDTQWSAHRRDHQYAGNVSESHDGYRLSIDRDYLDVSLVVPPPAGCPSNLDFGFYRTLGPGMRGPEVTAAQCLLARAGFDPGDATGFYGWRTGVAVRTFKESRDMHGDDEVLRMWSWTALISAGPTQFLHIGSVGLRVSKAQRALSARLRHSVAITGYFSSDTDSAVTQYQALVHLNQTGTIGTITWHALQTGR